MADRIDVLDVHIAGRNVGELTQRGAGRLSFSYDERWITGRVRIPLSLSMPTIAKTYEGKPVEAFLWGQGEGARPGLRRRDHRPVKRR